MKISAINTSYGFKNNRYNQSGINFTKKRSANYQYQPIPYGTDYSILNDIDLKREKTIPEIAEAKANNEDISEDREKLIFSRINMVQKDAEEFCKKYPQFNYDDVYQELIICMIRQTDKVLNSKGGDNNFFGPLYNKSKEACFKRFLKKYNRQLESDTIYAIRQQEREYGQPEANILNNDFRDDLKKKIEDTLSPRNAQIIMCTYGLNAEPDKTQRQMGEIYGISHERISQIKENALEKLKEADIFD